ncbi:putative phosphatase/phosphohexomutase [Anaerovibrio sp. JC8]|uniref:HAD family hydrolase n=1 Tax=Anaerovibrio sp. JC8 TaxID=1240085 RepID=UPI000A09FE0D|nr:HAD family phosphatase [Anaerovibrio sp. JC8]ORU01288.1 putative phosphatase/phosphohexomutase [Anaerovibrio sp. JC8]
MDREQQAFIFDMDGVIYDSEPIHARAKKQVLAECGISITDERLATFVGRSSKDFYGTMVQENPQCPVSWQELARRKHVLYKKMLMEDETITAIPGVRELLERIKAAGYIIGLGSSSTMEMIELVLGRFNLWDYFKAVVSGDDLPRSKPDPLIFLTVAEKLGVKPENCTVIEDAFAGVTAARAAGMHCIGYSNPNSGAQDLSGADKIVKSHDEIVV